LGFFCELDQVLAGVAISAVRMVGMPDASASMTRAPVSGVRTR
jgi:hypothetical protein